jgi:hypothetical protein
MILGQRTISDADKVQPTRAQIATNVIVLPKAFQDSHFDELNWRDFELDFFGAILSHKKLDSDRRFHAPIRDRVRPGDILKLSIANGRLRITFDQ